MRNSITIIETGAKYFCFAKERTTKEPTTFELRAFKNICRLEKVYIRNVGIIGIEPLDILVTL